MTLIAVLLSLGNAHAWTHTGRAWPALPASYCVVEADGTPEWEAEVEAVVDGWEAAAVAAGIGTVLAKTDCADAQLVISLSDSLAPEMVTMVESRVTGEVLGREKCEYQAVEGAEMSVNIAYFQPHQAGPDCAGMRRTLAQAVGFALGVGMSCRQLSPCGPEEVAALMAPIGGSECDYTPRTDDVASLTALYLSTDCDPYFEAPHETSDTGAPADTAADLHAPPRSPTTRNRPGCGCDSQPLWAPWWAAALMMGFIRRPRPSGPTRRLDARARGSRRSTEVP